MAKILEALGDPTEFKMNKINEEKITNKCTIKLDHKVFQSSDNSVKRNNTKNIYVYLFMG